MQPYKVLVSIEVLKLERLSRVDKDRLLSFLDRLAEDPGLDDGYQERDDVGRTVQIKILADYALTYWVDHAAREVKVVKVEKADRR